MMLTFLGCRVFAVDRYLRNLCGFCVDVYGSVSAHVVFCLAVLSVLYTIGLCCCDWFWRAFHDRAGLATHTVRTSILVFSVNFLCLLPFIDQVSRFKSAGWNKTTLHCTPLIRRIWILQRAFLVIHALKHGPLTLPVGVVLFGSFCCCDDGRQGIIWTFWPCTVIKCDLYRRAWSLSAAIGCLLVLNRASQQSYFVRLCHESSSVNPCPSPSAPTQTIAANVQSCGLLAVCLIG